MYSISPSILLGALANLRIITSLCPPLSLFSCATLLIEQISSHLTNFHKDLCGYFFFENVSRKFKFFFFLFSFFFQICQEQRVLYMETYVHLYLSHLFLERKMFRTNVVH